MPNEEPVTRADIEKVELLIQQLNERIGQLLEGVDARLGLLDRRADKVGDLLVGVQTETAGLMEWSERMDRHTLNSEKAQQIAIDNLADRVTRLERRPQS